MFNSAPHACTAALSLARPRPRLCAQWREALTHIPRAASLRLPGTALPGACAPPPFLCLVCARYKPPWLRVARRQARALSWRAGGSLDLRSEECSGAQLCSSAPGEAAVLLQRLRPGPAADSCLRRGTLLSGKLTPGFPWPWLLGGDKTRGVATECYRPVAPDHKRPLHAPDSSVLTLHTSHHPIVNSQIKTFSEQID